MRIQHNIMAMNAYRNYNTNTSALSGNLEKLSSGYKINRAGDDAAGLAISEKMRAQISGLEQASSNVKDGISLVKTGEGAMQEVQDMLNRMVTLATQSANGTYDNETDRDNLQKEVTALKDEINRIADSSNFNGINLLDGSMQQNTVIASPSAVQVTAVADGAQNGTAQAGKFTIDLSQLEYTNKSTSAADTINIKIAGQSLATDASAANIASDLSIATNGKLTTASIATYLNGKTVKIDGAVYNITADSSGKVTLSTAQLPTSAVTNGFNIAFTPANTASTVSNQGNGQSVTVVKQAISADANKYAQGSFALTTAMVKDGNVLDIGGTKYTFKVGENSTTTGENIIDLTAYDGTTKTSEMLQEAGKQISNITNDKFIVSTDNTVGGSTVIHMTEKAGKIDYSKDWDLAGTATSNTNGDWSKVVSYGAIDNETTTGGLKLQIGDTSDSYNQLIVSIKDIHTDSLGIDDIDISTQDGASTAIAKIKAAINSVSSTRGDLGAVQNRLEHTANNLSVMTENIQDAESTIRDTDIAEEMMSYTKNNILVQSAQAMLAQANTVPQGVLQLLQ
jgi:flagellin